MRVLNVYRSKPPQLMAM